MANDVTNLYNFIRQNASTEYQNTIPVATQNNIADIGNALTTYTNYASEFLDLLIRKICMEVINTKTWENPLSVLKKGGKPLGGDIQEVVTNTMKGSAFDPDGATLLNRTKPDVKAIYHRMNRQDKYKVTVSDDQMLGLFITPGKIQSLISDIVNKLYSSDNRDEFILMKNLMADAIADNKVLTVDSPVNTDGSFDESKGIAFLKKIRNISTYMTYPSTNYNKYFANKPTADTGSALETWTPKNDQILIIRSDILTELDTEVLASAFNMDKVALKQNIYELDSFGSATRCQAILADKAWIQVYDDLSKLTNFYNPEGLYYNYFWHHWQTYSLSLFANAVALLDPATT